MGELSRAVGPNVIRKELEGAGFFSLEALAHFVMVERPELKGATPALVAAETGLAEAVVRWLWFSDQEFRRLLDWYLVQGVYGERERASLLEGLLDGAMDPAARLSDRVRVAEYFDKKSGTAPSVSSGSVAPGITIEIVQEGDPASWEETHRPLRFGRVATSRVGSRTRGSVEVGRAGVGGSDSGDGGSVEGASGVVDEGDAEGREVVEVDEGGWS